jgi:heat shock protein HslJ
VNEGNGGLKRFIGLLTVLPLFAVGLAACAVAIDDSDERAEQVYGRTWIAVEVAGQPVAPGVESNLVVAPDGKVSGNTGCNGYFGSVIIAGQAMSFGNLGATKIACPEPAMGQEKRLLRALDGTRGYLVENDSLLLLDGAGAALVRFRLGTSA